MIIKKYDEELINPLSVMKTHHTLERDYRFNSAKEIGFGECIDYFLVDKGHVNGDEIHIITSNGIIFILNHITKRLITILIARPAQIKRYYNACKLEVPHYLINIAKINHSRHLNV